MRASRIRERESVVRYLVDEGRESVLLLALQERVDAVLEVIYIVAVGLEEGCLQFTIAQPNVSANGPKSY
jgi:hypothetical protein